MISAPPVSIVIPVFNRAALIGRAIASVLRQSFEDLELIIVDDGSTDDLAGVLAQIADSRIRLIRHDRNRGAAAARNAAIRASRARYIALIDSDDEWLPGKLLRQYEDLERDRSGALLGLTGFYFQREVGRREARRLATPPDWYGRIVAACNLSMGSCALIVRRAFDEIGLFDEALPRFEDWDWLLKYALRYPIRAIEEPLAIIHGRTGWPSVDAVERATDAIWRRHAGPAASRVPSACALLRSTIDYERAVALFHHERPAAAALALLRSLLGHPARRRDLWQRILRRRWGEPAEAIDFSRRPIGVDTSRVTATVPAIGKSRFDWNANERIASGFQALYDFLLLRCLLAGNTSWVTNAFILKEYSSLHDAANGLRTLAINHLLKEVGDAESAAHVLESLRGEWGIPESEDQAFFRVMSRYIARELAAMKTLPRAAEGRRRSVLSLVIWGDRYIERCARYCLASMRAGDNLAALARKSDVTLLIHTRMADRPRIEAMPEFLALGVDLMVRTIPDEVLELTRGDMKYWLLGGAQSVQLSFAALQHADFYMLFPDALYSRRYLENLAELAEAGADAVLLSGFRAVEAVLLPDLEVFRQDGIYEVPAASLLRLSLEHIHPYILKCFVGPDDASLPQHRALFANCGKYIEIHSPHYNVALVSASALRGFHPRYCMTLDSEIDKVVGSVERIHMRAAEDDYFATEVVDEDVAAPSRIPLEDYITFFPLHANEYHLRLFRCPYRIGCDWPRSAGLEPIEPSAAAAFFARIADRIEQRMTEEKRGFERLPLVLEVLRQFAESETGRQHPGLAERAAEAIRRQYGPASLLEPVVTDYAIRTY